jgi:hypothetical protein
MITKPKTDLLLGFPGPPRETLARHERLQSAFEELHAAALPLLDEARSEEGSASITLSRRIKGDHIQVTMQPRKEQ